MSCSTAGRHQTGFQLIILGNLVQECAEDWGLERHHYIRNNIQYYDTDWTQPWASCSYLFGCVNPSYLSKVWELIQGIVVLKAVTHFRWQWNNARYLHFVDRMHIFNHFSTWEREEKHFFFPLEEAAMLWKYPSQPRTAADWIRIKKLSEFKFKFPYSNASTKGLKREWNQSPPLSPLLLMWILVKRLKKPEECI